jgi:hypothetical protein
MPAIASRLGKNFLSARLFPLLSSLSSSTRLLTGDFTLLALGVVFIPVRFSDFQFQAPEVSRVAFADSSESWIIVTELS